MEGAVVYLFQELVEEVAEVQAEVEASAEGRHPAPVLVSPVLVLAPALAEEVQDAVKRLAIAAPFAQMKIINRKGDYKMEHINKKGRIFLLFFFVFLYLCNPFCLYADTGTYQILDYTVKLTPRSNGSVEMEYYQKWLVTGGHIPWITIGTANASYQIDQSKNRGNIRRIYAYNSSNWSGVRIDLDKDYLPNETFEVRFSLVQSRLFYADEGNYRLDFTPGWYDRAVTDRLVVKMHIFAPIDRVTAHPTPTRIEGQEIIWQKLNLRKGKKFSVSVSFPRSYMPSVQTDTLRIKEKLRTNTFKIADKYKTDNINKVKNVKIVDVPNINNCLEKYM